MALLNKSYEYKYAVFGDLLHETIYERLEEQHKKLIDIWLSGMLNGWDDVDCTRNGMLIHVSTTRMKFTFRLVEEYFPEVYVELATVIELVEDHFVQSRVVALDSPNTLERLEDAFNEWKSLAAVRTGN